MSTIIPSRPHGVNHTPTSTDTGLTFEQKLRLERRMLTAQIAQTPGRPCLPDASAWDDNVAKPAAQRLCRDCPIAAAKACGRVAVIDEAIAATAPGSKTVFGFIVSGTRGGMNAFTRRPLVKALAARITADRAERARQAEQAKREKAQAAAEKAAA